MMFSLMFWLCCLFDDFDVVSINDGTNGCDGICFIASSNIESFLGLSILCGSDLIRAVLCESVVLVIIKSANASSLVDNCSP